MRKAAYNSGRAGSKTLSTQSTAMGDSRLEYCDTTLLLSDLSLPNKRSGSTGCCRRTKITNASSVPRHNLSLCFLAQR